MPGKEKMWMDVGPGETGDTEGSNGVCVCVCVVCKRSFFWSRSDSQTQQLNGLGRWQPRRRHTALGGSSRLGAVIDARFWDPDWRVRMGYHVCRWG